MKLGLGTAQFGMDYGVSNVSGKPSLSEINNIITLAVKSGVSFLDTASLYGTSEEALGQVLGPNNLFNIITKTPRLSIYQKQDKTNIIRYTFEQSLKKLNQIHLYGLLVHQADDLLAEDGDTVFSALSQIKKEGWVKKIGVSIYSADQIDEIIKKYPIDLIQIPINVLDQRLLENNHLKRLKQQNIEVHARSVFLQGLLLMGPDQMPSYFNNIKNHMKRYHHWLSKEKLTSIEAALGFVSGLNEIDVVLTGVNSQQEFSDNLSAVKPLDPSMFKPFALSDEAFLNPSKWRLG